MAQRTKRKIIDTHAHIFQPSQLDYHWLSPESPLHRDIGLSEIQSEMDAIGIQGIVLVEATNTQQEIDYLLEIAERSSLNIRVIGYLEIEAESVIQHIDNYAKNPNFRGIRINYFKQHSNLDALFPAMQALAESNLVVDVLMNPEFIGDIVKLASLYPRITFVLDHFAGIPIADIQSQKWAEILKNLSRQSNIAIKISHYIVNDSLKDVIDYLIALIDIERLMFGSNFPMFITETSYTTICNSLISATEHLRDSERNAIFYENAIRIYQF